MTTGSTTRYSFASAEDLREEDSRTKRCPRCGQELFADMDTCFGCLYSFSQEALASISGVNLSHLDIDEIDEDEDSESATTNVFAPDDTLIIPKERLHLHEKPDELFVRICNPALNVRLPLPQEGLLIGRAATSDVVLHARSVSRTHLRIVPHGSGALAHDEGATNPSLVAGRELREEAELSVGDCIDVCGTTFTLSTS